MMKQTTQKIFYLNLKVVSEKRYKRVCPIEKIFSQKKFAFLKVGRNFVYLILICTGALKITVFLYSCH